MDLLITGAEIELDRAILDELADPMLHLLRNCIDHGIESVQERQRAGKSPKGRVLVSVRRQRDRVIVDVEDDGRGMDAVKLRAAAVTRGLVTVENAGPNPLTDITLREQSPWSGSAETWTCTASGGATCSAASGSGSLAGSVSIPAGGELSYTVSGTAAAGMPSGTLQYTLSATPPSGYGDPTPGDNTATGSINVLSGNIVDLSISITTSPAEPAFGEPVSYDFTIANQGPGTTDSQTVSFNLPMGASLQATLVGDSWSCATSTETVSCTRSAPLAPGQSSDLQLVLQPPTGAQSMQIAATVMASDGTDSDPSNNTALWNITIGESTIVATGGGLGCAVTRDPWQTSTNAVTLAGLVCVLLCLRVLTRRRRKGLV